jgi:hypothetical protein
MALPDRKNLPEEALKPFYAVLTNHRPNVKDRFVGSREYRLKGFSALGFILQHRITSGSSPQNSTLLSGSTMCCLLLVNLRFL